MDIETTQTTCWLLAYLLQYPDRDWRERLPAFREEAEALPDPDAAATLAAFLRLAEESDDMRWQDGYVRTFDFGKTSNLYLTYEQHGEERDRGPALLELKRQYAAAGFELAGGELPDYLPLMLEFASAAPWESSGALLGARTTALESIRRKLEQANSPYAPLMELLLRIVPAKPPNEAHKEAILSARGGD
ncbi:nitrate reductase molybdenum cofactor assembly chaperone [Cohnella sp.]|uniref:nitrate reductase molybdenum cofactor assembly chaperone n=1 Tax=Cohnella sp. TaxID=1883426 RepID=UPI00356326AD